MHGRAWSAALLLGVVLVLAGTGTTAAQTMRFSIVPARAADDPRQAAFFSYALTRGASVDDAVIVSNQDSAPITLRFYAADAVTAINGGTAFGGPEETRQGARRWLLATTGEITIPAGGRLRVPFSVRVPDDARPGDHVAGWVVEGPAQRAGGSGIGTTLVPRVGIAVVVRVAGEASARLALGDLCLNQESGSDYLQLTAANGGDVIVRASGTLRVLAEDGGELARRPIELGSIMPRDSTFLRVDAPGAVPVGRVIIAVDLVQSDGTPVSARIPLVVPERKVNGCAAPEAAQPAAQPRPAAVRTATPVATSAAGADPLLIAVVAAVAAVAAAGVGGIAAFLFAFLLRRRGAQR